MKKDIHPKYFPNARITCACGNVIITGATKESYEVEICSACHPFYTGKEKVIDTAGRVERFKRRATMTRQDKGRKKARIRKPRIENLIEPTITLRREAEAARVTDEREMKYRKLPPARGSGAKSSPAAKPRVSNKGPKK